MNPKLTDAGKNLLLRALTGENIIFTKLQLGNGPAQDADVATGLVNPLLTVEFSKIDVGKEYVTLVATFTNSAVESGFHITEVGFYAKDPDDEAKELLYALGNEDESAADYVPDNANRVFEMEFNALLFVGDAENVAAAINSSLVYATAADLDAHTSDENNPHKVTKSQVGLGKVPNVDTNDQTPTYTEATKLANLTSGEKLSVAFGKIKRAITEIINHIGNKNNPHGITAAQISAAAKSHTHNVSDINSGILGVARGGTGVNSYAALSKNLITCGFYNGNGEEYQDITLGFRPRAVLVMDYMGRTNYIRGDKMVYAGGLAVGYYSTCIEGQLGFVNVLGWTTGCTAVAIENTGFRVGCDVDTNIETNVDNTSYYYIAIK